MKTFFCLLLLTIAIVFGHHTDQEIDQEFNSIDMETIDFRNLMGIDFITTPMDEIISEVIKFHNITDPSLEQLETMREIAILYKDGGITRANHEVRCGNPWNSLFGTKIQGTFFTGAVNPSPSCAAYCNQFLIQSVKFYTTSVTTGQCDCMRLPFTSSNSMITAPLVSSGYFVNNGGGNCGAYSISNQRLYSNVRSVFSASTDNYCFATCLIGGYKIWTRGTGNCHCLGQNWNPQSGNGIMISASGWNSGFSFY